MTETFASIIAELEIPCGDCDIENGVRCVSCFMKLHSWKKAQKLVEDAIEELCDKCPAQYIGHRLWYCAALLHLAEKLCLLVDKEELKKEMGLGGAGK